MSRGRWFATGPDLTTAPSASTVDAGEAVRLAEARARFYGSELVWALVDGRAVLVERVDGVGAAALSPLSSLERNNSTRPVSTGAFGE